MATQRFGEVEQAPGQGAGGYLEKNALNQIDEEDEEEQESEEIKTD